MTSKRIMRYKKVQYIHSDALYRAIGAEYADDIM
jgi:hypothetical protein